VGRALTNPDNTLVADREQAAALKKKNDALLVKTQKPLGLNVVLIPSACFFVCLL
jgi:hypothetical protein